jgi:AcrR family transcriptional regulator
MKSIAKKTKPARRRLSEGERRKQILQAAFAIALREGLEAFTARSVAKDAGLSQGLVFFHFSSAEGLMDALIAEVTEATLAAAEPSASAERGDPAGPFGAFLADRLVSLDQEGSLRILPPESR